MPKQNLASMSVDALLKLREDIGAALSRKADILKKELASLGEDYARVGKIAVYGRKSLAGRKLSAKYRDKQGNTWAGRGAQPRWLTEAIKKGAKREDFLVSKPAKTARKKRRKAKKSA
jgi:DNA-binding protein H-NS